MYEVCRGIMVKLGFIVYQGLSRFGFNGFTSRVVLKCPRYQREAKVVTCMIHELS